MWRNPDDLSAKVYLGRDRDKFKVRVIVKDDKLCPSPANSANIWKYDSVQFSLQFPGQHGFFELGGGLTGDGKTSSAVWNAPYGFKLDAVRKSIQLNITEKNGLLYYDFAIPLKDLRVNAKRFADGFKFNLLVNDNVSYEKNSCYAFELESLHRRISSLERVCRAAC